MPAQETSLWKPKTIIQAVTGRRCVRRALIVGVVLVANLFLLLASNATLRADSKNQVQGTQALTQLHFCALILRVHNVSSTSQHVYVLMEPERVTEQNLRELFRSISSTYGGSDLLQVSVYTDIRQLEFLATGQAQSGPDNPAISEGKSGSATRSLSKEQNRISDYRWAYYVRWDGGEFFRFNADFPKTGITTVVITGKQ
jgi:hypothetical protein